ncbi:hypothetical protein OSSY52_18360 [Tepiditoga spiralis]|uniref:Helix-hairpin-helix DNA-binding motif class 1 domain-containing protein n=1 Tax=Tepiditoga spiralis TaxID=2108365 RepID=A0A7G1G6A4_9BACT|nr:DUF655 domain-containing protein [Tepiditoga spiralis]BBE31695.1 hypothetical protein OSSY52_18360 [Tepiditoga spiralis]
MKKFFYVIIVLLVLLIGYVNFKINIPKNMEDTENKINIQTSSIHELIKVPGIGYSKANDIILYREKIGFHALEDLKNVSGIGEKTFEKIKKYFYLEKKEYIFEKQKININNDSIDKLKLLPGVGEKTAKKIINYRNIKKFKNFEDLKKVGLSEKETIKLKGLIEF